MIALLVAVLLTLIVFQVLHMAKLVELQERIEYLEEEL